MRIDDEELRDIFQASCEERIQAIDDGLLHLESQPDNLTRVEAMLRDAHSLKGDSNMLGLEDLGRLAHQIESVLSEVKRGDRSFTSDLGDRLARSMVAIRSMVQEAITGQPADIQLFYVLADLMGGEVYESHPPEVDPTASSRQSYSVVVEANDSSEPKSSKANREANNDNNESNGELAPDCWNNDAMGETLHPPRINPPAVNHASDSAHQNGLIVPDRPAQESCADITPKPIVPNSPFKSGYRIETVRVPTHHLDSLMTQAGELTVTKIRIAHRLAEAEAISNLWEEWNRDIFVNRSLFDGSSSDSGKHHPLQRFLGLMERSMETLGKLSNQLSTALYEDITRLETLSDELEDGIRTLRLLPLSTIFNLFPRLVRDLARQEGKTVNFVVEGGDTKADKRILEEMKDPILHLLRNAIDHGIEPPEERIRAGKPEQATLRLRGYQTGNAIALEISDDGRGLDTEAIKEMALRKGLYRSEELDSLTIEQLHTLILSPGFSTRLMVTDVSGRGVGLDVLRTNVEKLKGHIEIESQPGQGCTFRIRLGTTLSTAHVLIVSVGQTAYALPVEYVEKAQLVYAADLATINHQPIILHNGDPISVTALVDLLECHEAEAIAFHQAAQQQQSALACIILKVGMERFGIFVDELLDEQDVVLKPQSQLLKRVRNVLGATILGTGEVCMVLNPPDLLQSIKRLNAVGPLTKNTTKPRSSSSHPPAPATSATGQATHQTILLVEDSIATRTQEKRILESAGYGVVTAVDGLDGFSKLQMQHFDAVVSDVQMPNLDGLGLTERIRKHREYSELPIILVTTLASDDDRRRGAEAGANAYIPKSSFSQDILLDTLERLI